MKRRLRTLVVLSAMALTGTLGLAHAGAAPAAQSGAQGCTDHGWSDKSSGQGTPKDGAVPIPVRSGPHDYCGVVDWVRDPDKTIWYHCYARNESGNTWTHGRKAGAEVTGWVWDGNLQNGGSLVLC